MPTARSARYFGLLGLYLAQQGHDISTWGQREILTHRRFGDIMPPGPVSISWDWNVGGMERLSKHNDCH